MKKYAPWAAAVIALIVVLALLVVPKLTNQDAQENVPATVTPVVTQTPAAADPTAEPANAEASADAAVATEAPAAQEEATSDEATATVSGDTMAATVNGQTITYDQVNDIAQSLMYTYSQYGYDFSDESMLNSLYGMAMEYAVQMEVMRQKAVEWGFDKMSEEEKATAQTEVDAEWENLINTYIAYYVTLPENPTEADQAAAREDALAGLAEMGYSKDMLMTDYTESIMFEKMEAEVVKDVKVSDEDVKAAYDEAVAADQASYAEDVATYEYMTQYYGQTAYYQPEGYRGITHILLEVDEALLEDYQTKAAQLEEQLEAAEAAANATATPEVTAEAAATAEVAAEATAEAAEPTATPAPTAEPVTQEDVDKAYAAVIASVQPTIDEINKKLADGAAFEDLIVEYGKDPGMESEPNKSQGYSVHMDSIMWDPAFVKAAFSVDNVGDVAEPVLGSYGVHIVKYLRDVPAGPVELTDELTATLREQLLSTQETEKLNAALTEWMNAAQVVYATAEAAEAAEAPAAE